MLGLRGAPALMAPLVVFVGLLQLHLLYATDYVLEGDRLRIRASLFRWQVPLAAIDSVEPTRNPLSSPACSLDRLLVRYGSKRIMISPLDKPFFLRALALRTPQLELMGESAHRRA